MSKSYKDAVDKIVLSEELKQKIISQNISANKETKHIKFVNFKALSGMAAGLIICLVCVYVFNNLHPYVEEKSVPDTNIENNEISVANYEDETAMPIPKTRSVDMDTSYEEPQISVASVDDGGRIDDVQSNLGYVPDGYELKESSVTEDVLLEVYESTDDILTYKVQKSTLLSQSEFEGLEDTVDVDMDGKKVMLYGNGELYNISAYEDGEYTHILHSKKGFDAFEFLKITVNIR